MIAMEHDTLRFRFPEVHQDAGCSISFYRTLRIPDDGREYPLPPGLERFPLSHVDDYSGTVPDSWSRHGGIFLPMYQSEAMWLSFSGDYPMAVKIATGKVSALTGEPWQDRLRPGPVQDYIVIPDQPWLDGFYSGKGRVRQFVAAPLGEGYTAEEQITGKHEHGGLQIVAYPMKAEIYERRGPEPAFYGEANVVCCNVASQEEMGLAPGGLMRQEIYEDSLGLSAWDMSVKSRCFVHILNSSQYFQVTHKMPPTRPPTAEQYTAAGLPWFDYYDAERNALASPTKLLQLKSIETMRANGPGDGMPDKKGLRPGNVIKLSKKGSSVREGEF